LVLVEGEKEFLVSWSGIWIGLVMRNGRNCKNSEKGTVGAYTILSEKRKIILKVTL
jgi:hypothetical protein